MDFRYTFRKIGGSDPSVKNVTLFFNEGFPNSIMMIVVMIVVMIVMVIVIMMMMFSWGMGTNGQLGTGEEEDVWSPGVIK